MTSPLPVPDSLTRHFWDGCRQGTLTVQECRECHGRFFVPQAFCPTCWSGNWEWVVSDGLGAVYSYTVVHRPVSPELAAPYVVAIIELDDGWTMMSNVVGCTPEAVSIGARVRVAFRRASDAITLPVYELVGSGDAIG